MLFLYRVFSIKHKLVRMLTFSLEHVGFFSQQRLLHVKPLSHLFLSVSSPVTINQQNIQIATFSLLPSEIMRPLFQQLRCFHRIIVTCICHVRTEMLTCEAIQTRDRVTTSQFMTFTDISMMKMGINWSCKEK